MRIDLSIHRKLYHALYSDVFLAEELVYKLFKRYKDANLDDRAATLFEAQCDAYVRAARDPIMSRHIPQFFGPCSIDAVLDEHAEDVSEGYRLQACYVLEKLNGREAKVTSDEVLTKHPYVFNVRNRFADYGIDTSDASVFSFADPDGFKLIDITSTFF